MYMREKVFVAHFCYLYFAESNEPFIYSRYWKIIFHFQLIGTFLFTL